MADTYTHLQSHTHIKHTLTHTHTCKCTYILSKGLRVVSSLSRAHTHTHTKTQSHTHSLSIGNAITNFETGFHGLRFICKKKLPNNQGKHLFFISDFLGSATLKELSPTFIVTDSMVFQGKALISLCYWVGFKEFLVCLCLCVFVCVSV